jgi:hypothetical protein
MILQDLADKSKCTINDVRFTVVREQGKENPVEYIVQVKLEVE